MAVLIHPESNYDNYVGDNDDDDVDLPGCNARDKTPEENVELEEQKGHLQKLL